MKITFDIPVDLALAVATVLENRHPGDGYDERCTTDELVCMSIEGLAADDIAKVIEIADSFPEKIKEVLNAEIVRTIPHPVA